MEQLQPHQPCPIPPQLSLPGNELGEHSVSLLCGAVVWNALVVALAVAVLQRHPASFPLQFEQPHLAHSAFS